MAAARARGGWPSLSAVALWALWLTSQTGQCWKCGEHETVCEITLVVENSLTMMKEKSLVIINNGSLFAYDETEFSAKKSIPAEHVVTGDGWGEPRVVVTVNGTLPGPLLEVYEGQTVRVTVVNKLFNQISSVHFHGQHQRGTPWMDGVAYVTQCPIGPGQTFVYHFTAYPSGTFWYHSHVSLQRDDGLYGGFNVHPRRCAAASSSSSSMKRSMSISNKTPSATTTTTTTTTATATTSSSSRCVTNAPVYHREFTLFVQDWNHDWDGTMGFLKMVFGMYVGGEKEAPRNGMGGVHYSLFRAQSLIINGRGRHRATPDGPHNGAPISSFLVRQGELYRFRLVHPGTVYPYQLSVDGHRLKVIATDGMDLKEPIVADAVIVTPGERFDFELTANQTVDNYWIRVTTLQVPNPVTSEAILRYEGAPDSEDPSSDKRRCTYNHPCVVVNCPFHHFPNTKKHQCVNIDDLRHSERIPHEMGRGAKNVKEFFMNWGFPGTTFTPGSVNGVQLQMPRVSALTQPMEVTTRCPGDGYRCEEDTLCLCTPGLDVGHGDVIQLVFTNMGMGRGWDHPIHMHGHSFYVLKVGYPQYDNHTAAIIGDNLDIDCRGNPNRDLSYCNRATWTNASWASSGNAVPGLELDYPVRKDTVNVPTGGYVVVRIKADNPGLWPMHCHVSLHADDGMFMLINESFARQPDPPLGFPQCRDFVADPISLSGRG